MNQTQRLHESANHLFIIEVRLPSV